MLKSAGKERSVPTEKDRDVVSSIVGQVSERIMGLTIKAQDGFPYLCWPS